MNKTISFWAALGGALTIGVISIGLSFNALTDLGVRAGMGYVASCFWAIVIDALVLTSIAAVASLSGWRYAYSWMLLCVSEAATVSANYLHAALTHVDIPAYVIGGIAVVPPVAGIATIHLAIMLGHERQSRQAAELEVTNDASVPKLEQKFGRALASVRRMAVMTQAPMPVASTPVAPVAETQPVVLTQEPVAPTQPVASVSQDDAVTQDDAPVAETRRASVASMPSATPEPVRQQILSMLIEKMSGRDIADANGVSEPTVRRIKTRAIASGELIKNDDGTLTRATDAVTDEAAAV